MVSLRTPDIFTGVLLRYPPFSKAFRRQVWTSTHSSHLSGCGYGGEYPHLLKVLAFYRRAPSFDSLLCTADAIGLLTKVYNPLS